MTNDELVIETVDDDAPAAPQAPPPPQEQAAPFHAMAAGEQFTREQYLNAGWTDDQLISAGKMIVIAPPPAKVDQTAAVGLPKSRWIVLDDNDDIPPTGLFVGHNGNSYLLQTGIPMLVPENVLSVLDDAIMDAPVTDPKTRQVIGYRPRPRYTYREVHAPVDV
jgi:hypothetical protein